MSAPSHARHRAARRPATPLTTFTRRASGPTPRRAALAVAGSGLALAVLAPGAVAAPDAVALPAVDVNALAREARAALAVSPTVKVPTEGQWAVAPAEVAGEKPPPPPPPPPAPEPVARQATAASRTAARPAATAVAPAPAQVAAPSSATAAAVLAIARRYVGTPYVYGGATPAGFDCSGFTQYVFAQVGISLPRSSSAQRYAGTVVPASQAQPGDLIWGPGHVGIYTGNGQHIAARNPSTRLYEGPIYIANPVFIRVL